MQRPTDLMLVTCLAAWDIKSITQPQQPDYTLLDADSSRSFLRSKISRSAFLYCCNMRFFTFVFPGATIFGLFASASPLEVRQDALQPFQITAVHSNSPPGRPGSPPCMQPLEDFYHMTANSSTQGGTSPPMSLIQTPTCSLGAHTT